MFANFQSLLIGSLPHGSPEEALEVVFRYCPNTPSWPQLPKISNIESMSIQYLEGIPGWIQDEDDIVFKEPEEIENLLEIIDDVENRRVEKFPISDKFSLTFNKFIGKIENREGIKIVKGQIIGPITFLTSHKKRSGRLLISDDLYRDIVPKILKLKADFQVKAFSKANKNSERIIFFDEPVLSQIGSAVLNLKKEDIREIYKNMLLEKRDYYVGMHICGNSEWDFIMSLPIEIVNFDAFNYLDEFFLYKGDIKRFIERGGYLAFGLIPTDSELLRNVTEKEIDEKKEFIIGTLLDFLSIEKIRERTFITPSCGMGALTIEESLKVLEILRKMSAE